MPPTVLFVLLPVFLAGAGVRAAAGALEDYVARPDRTYQWKATERKRTDGATAHHLEMVSQTWRGQFWSHHLMVIQPDAVRNADWAMLYISGGGNNPPGDKELALFNEVAQRAGVLACILTRVPNQPLYDGRHEDALIAYTFDQYTKSGDKTWPLLFPMVKSAVRAMDTIQALGRTDLRQRVDKFVVTGASKRGWTTWLTGATDSRVQAIAPMVIDMLNMKVQLDWSVAMYGQPSEEIDDYTRIGFHRRMDEPAMVQLRSWVDPFGYRERYRRLPKLLLLGTNDPYWVVDSLRHYYGELPGPKLVFQTPNAGHDLAGGKEAVRTLAAWVQMLADRQTLPQMDWTIDYPTARQARLSVRLDRAPAKLRLWTATSKDRDFRDDKWVSSDLGAPAGAASVTATVDAPAEGYRAFLVEAELGTSTGQSYKLSTEARVVPDGPPPKR
jgi:PhoPQ-activated pathogenicity-related protein